MNPLPALPRWRHVPEARPLLAWRADDRGAVARKVDEVLHAWSLEWGVALEAGSTVRCTPAQDAARAAGDWVDLGTRGEGGAWLRWPSGADAWLANSWFGDSGTETPVVAAVVQFARQDLALRMAGGLQLRASADPAPPPDASWKRWSGAVVIALPCGSEILAESAVVAGLLARPAARHDGTGAASRGALVGIAQALAAAQLRLRVELDGCELALGDLQGFQLGDVLRLRHRTDAPAIVRPDEGDALFAGWLACSRGRRAIELAPAQAR